MLFFLLLVLWHIALNSQIEDNVQQYLRVLWDFRFSLRCRGYTLLVCCAMPSCQSLPFLRRNEVSTTVFQCCYDHHREYIYETTNPKLTCGNRSKSVFFALHVLLCVLLRRSFKIHIVVPVHVVKVCRWSRGMAPFILNLDTRWKWMVYIAYSKYTNAEIYSHDSSILLGKPAWFHVTQFNPYPTNVENRVSS